MSPDLRGAAARNLAIHCTWVQGRAPGMRALVTPGLAQGDSGLDTDTFNVVCAARLEAAGAAAAVASATAWYGDRPFSWWLSPGDGPSELPDLLAGAGLTQAESEVAMACALSDLAEPGPRPGGLTIRRVRTPSDLGAFAGLLASLAEPPEALIPAFYRAAESLLLSEACPLRLYLGILDGRPVATAEATVAGGVAGLYNVSTLSGERRRGIGTAMTVAPLLDAREEGVSHAVLQAAADGVGVYERVGFTRSGTVREFKPARRGEPNMGAER